MKRRATSPFATTVLALTFGLCFLVGGASAAEPGRARGVTVANGWIMNDLAAAQAEARKTGKPIFVVFRCEA